MSAEPRHVSKAALWTGRVLSALPVPMLLMGPVMYLSDRAKVVQGMEHYGYPTRVALPLIVVEVICTILYIIPQTAVLGATLLTAWLGGAVSTHVRAGEPFWFPIVFGVVLWLGLFLRDRRVRALTPIRELH